MTAKQLAERDIRQWLKSQGKSFIAVSRKQLALYSINQEEGIALPL